MKNIKKKLIQSLSKAGEHNQNLMVAPKVVLWLDPDRQWSAIIPELQQELPHLLVLGEYDPENKQGPPIWLKCMVDHALPAADWSEEIIPIIYMPGISKRALKNVAEVPLGLQPLVEYQYTGTLWLHENGREWTVAGFIQSPEGFGVQISQDKKTKEALLNSLGSLLTDEDPFYGKEHIDADFLLNRLYPNIAVDILKWIEQGDSFLYGMSSSKQEIFKTICESKYHFTPDTKNIKQIVQQLGSQKDAWSQVWEYFSHAPARYPMVQKYLRLAKPDDLGEGLFELPRDSWPQENEEAEKELLKALNNIPNTARKNLIPKLQTLIEEHKWREESIWDELGEAPLLNALCHLEQLAVLVTKSYTSGSLEQLIQYYTDEGIQVDKAVRQARAAVSKTDDIKAVSSCIYYIYKPWLEVFTEKFQQHFISPDSSQTPQPEAPVVLFIDALRYDVAKDLVKRLSNLGEVELTHHITALPSLTPTAKPYNSPLSKEISRTSSIKDFRPSLNGKDLTTNLFRNALSEVDYKYISSPAEIEPDAKYWLEIGTLDTRGHQEQSGMVRRIPELLDEAVDLIQRIHEQGIKKITIVTDHGWLLLPGGLPKATATKDLLEIRWGRCALIKEGAKVDLPQYPWTWNPEIYIAYAPGIAFFKANEEYAHGGISAQECIVPQITLSFKQNEALSGRISDVDWNNLICHITLEDAPDGFLVDIRRVKDDENSSVVFSKKAKRVVKDNKARLMVDDTYEREAAHVILMNKEKIILDTKLVTIGG